MRLITNEELFAVAGGEMMDDDYESYATDGSSGGGSIPTVTITASKADVQAAKDEYAAQQTAASFIGAAAGIGAGAVVTGLCIGVPAALSGPAAPETAAVLTRPCTYLGGVVGTGVGTATTSYLKNNLK